MAKARKDQDEKDLEKLAKKLLSMPHKPREAQTYGKQRVVKPKAKNINK